MRLINSYGSRYVRNCLARVTPNYLIEKGLEWCRETLDKGSAHKPLIDRAKAMIEAFAPLGVVQSELEAYAKCKLEFWTEKVLGEFRGVYKAIRDGEATGAQYSKTQDAEVVEQKGAKASEVLAALKK